MGKNTGKTIGSILGTAAGAYFGGPAGAQAGGAIGGKVGGSFDSGGGTQNGGGGSGMNANNAAMGGGGGGNMGIGMGALQLIQAARLKQRAESAMPQMEDPRMVGFLAELNQKRKSIDTGADFAAGMNAIDQTTAQTDSAITKMTGGDVGGTIQGLLQAERTAGQNKNDVFARGQENQKYYTGLYGDFMDKIAARKLQLQMYRSQQARAEWAQTQQDAVGNVMGGLAKMGNMDQQAGGMFNPSTVVPSDTQAGPDMSAGEASSMIA